MMETRQAPLIKVRRRRAKKHLDSHALSALAGGELHAVRAVQAQRRRAVFAREALRQVADFLRSRLPSSLAVEDGAWQ